MLRREIVPLLAILGGIAYGIVFGYAVGTTPRAQAAPPSAPPCEPINSAGSITIYRCVPDTGLPYLINSVGMMMVEE